MNSAILSALLCLVFAISAEAAKVTVAIGPFGIDYYSPDNTVRITPGVLGGFPLEPRSAWDAKRESQTVYRVRIPEAKNIYLKLNAEKKQVFAMSGGTFERGDGSEKLLKNAVFAAPPPIMQPVPGLILIQLADANLVFDGDGKDVAVIYEGLRLLGPEDIEIIKSEEGIYHVRLRGLQKPKSPTDSFWKIDTRKKSLALVTGHFGERGGREISFDARVTVEDKNASAAEQAVHEDIGMAGVNKNEIRQSSWISAEQELFHEILGKQQYDVLVVPFQVQDNAFDHIERSLMTQYLTRQIRMTTNLRVADPDSVEHALGRGFRTFSEQSVYTLANALGVKKLIRGYVGHNRDMKMRLTFTVQERAQGGFFDTATKSTHALFKDIIFSDEKLPSEVFATMFPTVFSALGINEERKDFPVDIGDLSMVQIPITPIKLLQSQDKSSVVQAAQLAILGAVSPPGSQTSQAFFERSLMLLRGAAPKSTDAVFLKAYALLNLYRRPAAVDVLNRPSTPEQLALRSALDGDLMALPEQVTKIKNPLPKLLMQFALNDLRWSYDNQTARFLASTALQEMPPDWKLFYTRRYAFSDHWDVPNTGDLKQFLDDHFPVKGYSLQDIVHGMLVRGDVDAGDTVNIDASVHEHRKRLLKDRPDMTTWNNQGSLRPLDILDLHAAWAEETFRKRIGLPVYVQGLYEEGLSMVDRYETVFRGHPELAVLKSNALGYLAKQKGGEKAKNLLQMAYEVNAAACLWFQGQTPSANRVCFDGMYYENDFPRRAFWRRHKDSSMYGDRADYELKETVLSHPLSTNDFFAGHIKAELRDLELALRYVTNDFSALENYYKALPSPMMASEADILLERNKHRFNGNSRKATFLADIYEKRGDDAAIVKLYEDTIRVVPRGWQSYYELGTHYLFRGDARRAVASFRRFPPFKNGANMGDGDNSDTVALSNYAFRAGQVLRFVGAIQDAKPFYELSAGYQTGSGAGMWSEYQLALLDGDYQRAVQTMLAVGRRYSSDDAYVSYLQLLSVTGHRQESESLFFSLGMMDKSFIDWSSIITGLRMAGTSDDAVRAWLAENAKGKVNRDQARLYYLRALLIDRQPDAGLAEMLDNIDRHVPLAEQQRPPIKYFDQQRRELPSIMALFARVRYEVTQKQHEKVVGLLTHLNDWYSLPNISMQSVLPYFAWSGTKTGKTVDVDKVLATHREKNGRDFEYWLATAMKQAAERKHDDALRSLDLARSNVSSSFWNMRPVQAWYQLVETCELLFDDTQVVAYRERALELARIYQSVRPLDSWAYAVEAKYAKSAEERLQPLAKTLYLDKRSYRIVGIPEQEKEKAREWLEKNNPFLETLTKQKIETNNANSDLYASVAMTKGNKGTLPYHWQ